MRSGLERPQWTVAAAGLVTLLTMAPPLLAAFAYGVKQPVLYFDGDYAVDELALMRSGHLAQLVGNYSRFRWNHPGPAWFYALDTVYQPLGAHSWAFVVATLALNSILLGLIVIAAWHARGPLFAMLVAALLLLYVGGLGDQLFRDPWPPFAVILPMCLLLVLAASAAAGSTPSLLAALVTGTYLVQTHLGTAPTAAAVVGSAVVLRIAMLMASSERKGPPLLTGPRPLAGMTVPAIVLVVLMWAPPIIDGLTNHPGNLSLLWTFFTSPHPTHRFLEAISVLGRFLWVPEMSQLRTLHDQDLAAISPRYLVVAVVFAVLCLLLALLGTLAHDRFAQAMGVISGVALVAIVFSIHSISGPVYAYLLHWVSTLPLALTAGWLSLALSRSQGVRTTALRSAGASWTAALLVCVVGLSIARSAGFLALPGPPAATPDVRQAWTLTASALDSVPHQPVVVELQSSDTWILAAGVALQLAKAGYPVRVHDELLFMYGSQSRLTGDEQLALTVLNDPDVGAFEVVHPDAQLVGRTGIHTLFLRRLHSP